MGETGQGEEGEEGGLELPHSGSHQDSKGQLEAGSEEGHDEPHQEQDTAPASLRVVLPEHYGALYRSLEDPASPGLISSFLRHQPPLHLTGQVSIKT